jgi:hypothetical protein
MAPVRPEARDPADSRRRITLTREQRDRIDTAAAALEAHAGHDEDPLTMLLAAAELRGVVGEWDVANDARSADPVEQRLRQALRQIANAESGAWGWIARDALDDREPRSNRDIGAHGDGRAGDSRRCDRRPRPGPAGAPMTTGRGSDGPPSSLEQAVITALLRRPVRYLRELLAEAERREQPDLARLARQVLAWRAGQRG